MDAPGTLLGEMDQVIPWAQILALIEPALP